MSVSKNNLLEINISVSELIAFFSLLFFTSSVCQHSRGSLQSQR